MDFWVIRKIFTPSHPQVSSKSRKQLCLECEMRIKYPIQFDVRHLIHADAGLIHLQITVSKNCPHLRSPI